MKRSARMSCLKPAIGLAVWLCTAAGLLQRSAPVFGDQADRDLWPLRVSDSGRGFTEPGPQLPNTGACVFQIPGKNQSGQRDWVLVLGDIK